MKTIQSLSIYVKQDEVDKAEQFEKAINDAIYWRHGVNVSLAPSRKQGKKGYMHYILQVCLNEDIINRKAGRKPIACAITIEEALEMEKTNTDKKLIAAQMGVSLATYYRKRQAYLASETTRKSD